MWRLGAAAALAALATSLVASLPAVADAGGPASSPESGPATPAFPAAPSPGNAQLAGTSTPGLTSDLRVVVRRADPARAALSFLAARQSTYRITDPARNLRRIGGETADGSTVERFAQRYKGVSVLGGQYLVRLQDKGTSTVVTGTSGSYFSRLDVQTGRRVPTALARFAALRALPPSQQATKVVDDGSVILPFGRGIMTRHLTVLGRDLAHGVPLRQEMYFTLGVSKPVLSYSSIDFDGPTTTTGAAFHSPTLPLNVYQRGTSYELRDDTKPMFASDHGEIKTYDASNLDVFDFLAGGAPSTATLVSSSTVPFSSATNTDGALDAHWGAGQVYDFYKRLGRNSLDGKGGSINSYAGVTEDGQPFVNAFWDGAEMVYGSGGDGYKPLAASLDVVGHEMTHAVVQHTAGLLDFGQASAMNEGIADYFGNAIEDDALKIPMDSPDGPLIGQDLCLHKVGKACATRDLDTLKTVKAFDGEGDEHANSTIVSGAFWQTRKILGPTLGDKVMYAVLTQYLTPLSQFIDARHATVAAAAAAGATASQIAAIRGAFDKRGIVDGWERKVERIDSRTLVRGLTYGGTELATAGNHWVVTDTGPLERLLPSVYTGTIDGRQKARLISPNPKDVYDVPATDGHHVAWTTTTIGSDDQIRTLVQTRSLSGGKVHTVATVKNGLVVQLGISGRTLTWEAFTLTGGDGVFVHRPGGRTVRMPTTRIQENSMPAVRGHQVVYVDTVFPRRRQRPYSRLMSYDVPSGRRTALATAHGRHQPGLLLYPVITAKHVVVAVHGQSTAYVGFTRLDRNGQHPTAVVPERSRRVLLPYFTATDTALTWLDPVLSNGKAFLKQKALRPGGSIERVSCSRGAQFSASAGIGRRVVFMDDSSGRLDLVTRTKPVATHC